MALAFIMGEATLSLSRDIISGCWKGQDTGLSPQASGRSAALRPFWFQPSEMPVGLLASNRADDKTQRACQDVCHLIHEIHFLCGTCDAPLYKVANNEVMKAKPWVQGCLEGCPGRCTCLSTLGPKASHFYTTPFWFTAQPCFFFL